MRFRTKTIVGVAVIEMALLAVLVGSALSILRDSNEAELTRRVQLGGKLLAVAAKDAVISQDLATLDSLVAEAMTSGQIAFVRILDAGGTVLAQQGDATLLARPFQPDASVSQVNDGVFEWSAAVLAGGIRQGEVRLGVSTDPLKVLLASARRWAAGIAGVEIALVALFSWLLGSYLARQLVALREASQHFADGDFSHRVPLKGDDELAQTARAFNLMAQQLGDGQALLAAENAKRLQAQLEADKSGNLLREAVSSIAQGFTIYDENDRLVHCNEAYLGFYQTSRDLIVPGNTFEMIVRQGAERGQYSEAVGNIDAWVQQRVAQHQNANGEVIEQRLADGRWLLIVEHRTPSGYIVGNRIDITQRREAEAHTREYAEQLKAIFDLSPDGFVAFDGAHQVKYVSPAFTRLTALAPDAVIGLDEGEFSHKLTAICLPQAGFPGLAALRALAMPGAGRRHKIELADASQRVLEVGLRESQAESVSQILYLRDVTHETEVDRLKSEFLSTAAHELRTPMASIYGFAEVLMTQELDEADRQEFLEIIFRQSELMASILNELLDLARIEARRGKDFVFEATPVQALVDEVVREFKLPVTRSTPTLLAPAAPLYILADHHKVQQAILNVLSNAYKYSAPGSDVSIAIEARAPGQDTDPPTQGAAPMVAIRIRDHGIGLTPEQLRRVGERFYRADTSGKVSGTGLGMSIVKEIVDLHGGRLELASEPGAGTTVTLWLPASPA